MSYRVYLKKEGRTDTLGRPLGEYLAYHIKAGFDTGLHSNEPQNIEARQDRISEALGRTLELLLNKGTITVDEMLEAAGASSYDPDRTDEIRKATDE